MIFILSLFVVILEDLIFYYVKSIIELRNKERNKLVLEDVLYIKFIWFLMFFIYMFLYIFILSIVFFV